MNTQLRILIGVVLIVLIGGIVLVQKNASVQNYQPAISGQNTPQTSQTDQQTNGSAENNASATAGITAAEVATHNSAASCWSTINGSVYDLTSWIPNHPGGPQAILQLCGTDGSSKFNRKHGGNSRVLSVLAGFKIGVAAQ